MFYSFLYTEGIFFRNPRFHPSTGKVNITFRLKNDAIKVAI
jgi:hypothetical protein